MTPEETRQQAQAEGLTLRVADNASGYYGVNHRPGRSKPFDAQMRHCGTLGSFATAEEAALCVARSPEGQVAAQRAAAAAPLPLTSGEALRQAQTGGLTLLKSNQSVTGFFGVSSLPRSDGKPYQAQVARDGKKVHLGRFATAEEAALYVARSPEGKYEAARRAAAARAAPPKVPLTPGQALQQAEETGTQLRKSKSNSSGYTDVHVCVAESAVPLNAPGPYRACTRYPGGVVYRGFFATPEEAALHAAQPHDDWPPGDCQASRRSSSRSSNNRSSSSSSSSMIMVRSSSTMMMRACTASQNPRLRACTPSPARPTGSSLSVSCADATLAPAHHAPPALAWCASGWLRSEARASARSCACSRSCLRRMRLGPMVASAAKIRQCT